MVIYKYELTGFQTRLDLPKGAKFLKAAASTSHRWYVWFLVEPESPMVTRFFKVFATGEKIKNEGYKYLTTFFEAEFVWHLFELEKTP